jgi:hypothetical protein
MLDGLQSARPSGGGSGRYRIVRWFVFRLSRCVEWNCVRRVAQLHESKTASTVQAITDGLTKALGCRRIVFETGRLAPILFHG